MLRKSVDFRCISLNNGPFTFKTVYNQEALDSVRKAVF
jgi:hypothetical protein